MSAVTGPVTTRPAGVRGRPKAAARRVPWSDRRVSAAVAATRRKVHTSRDALHDEVEFFVAHGTPKHVPSGATLVRLGRQVGEVHLIRDGAFAVMGHACNRWPILAFVLPNEFCCPVPALLHEPAPWEAVAVTDASVISVPAAEFTRAVRDRWSDRWSTRTLTTLAEIAARTADVDAGDLTRQAAALLLRLNGEISVELCRDTICDLLDADRRAVERIIAGFERAGAVRLAGDRIRLHRAEILRSAVAAVPSPRPGQDKAAPDPAVSGA